jgi:hypothetical protein
VRSIVIAPAKTGRDESDKKAVINTAQTKGGKWCIVIPGVRILETVVMMFIEPRIEGTPAECELDVADSTAAEE